MDTNAPLWIRLSCAIWGHVVHNDVFRRGGGERRCRCGRRYLHEDGSATHVRHTLSCFLRHHTYVRLADRDGVREYVCVRCGHPLVFREGEDPFAARERFAKKVRYRCGLFGHRVRAVASRDGFVEYACGCGHSFLKPQHGEGTIRHPLVCFFFAHRIVYLTHRAGYAEFVCRDCGHPFCFVAPASAAAAQPWGQAPSLASPTGSTACAGHMARVATGGGQAPYRQGV